MPFPRRVREALEEVGHDNLPGTPALDAQCAGAKFHSPTPLLLHETPLSFSGDGERVSLCSTCCDNLRVLQHLLIEHDGELPWVVRREFGNIIRALALRGWELDQPDDDEVGSSA